MKKNLPIEEQVINEIHTFIKKVRISKSAFGQAACGDPKVLKRLEDGKEIRSSTINAIRTYITNNTPEQAKRV